MTASALLDGPFSLAKTLAPSPSPSSSSSSSSPISPFAIARNHTSVAFPSSSLFSACVCSVVAKPLQAPTCRRNDPAQHAASVAEEDTSLSARSRTGIGIVPVLREFGFDEEEAEALLQRHRPLSLACPESLRRRLVSVHSAGVGGFVLPLLAAKKPEILTSEEVDHFISFVADELGGIDPPKLERLLTTTSHQTLGHLPDRIRLLADHGVPQDGLRHVINSVNIKKVFCERSSKELEETVLLLERIGGGGADLILRRPLLLNLDLESQMLPRIAYLAELAGGDEEAAGKLIRKLPSILAYTVEHFETHLEFWCSIGLTREQIFKIVLVYPSVFSVSRERKLVPRIEFLKQCGLDADAIFKFLVKAPLFLSLSSKNLGKKLAFLVKMGFRHGTRDMAAAAGAVTRTSCENLQGVVGLLLGYGFCIGDVMAMSRRHPQLLQYNYESLEEKLEYLVGEMEREVGELLAFPAFLGYKLHDRIKHRYEVKKEVRGKGMSLNKLLSVSTETFSSTTRTGALQNKTVE